jgi:hypothetical protein
MWSNHHATPLYLQKLALKFVNQPRLLSWYSSLADYSHVVGYVLQNLLMLQLTELDNMFSFPEDEAPPYFCQNIHEFSYSMLPNG